jgi:hypothetical protein
MDALLTPSQMTFGGAPFTSDKLLVLCPADNFAESFEFRQRSGARSV